MKNENSTSVVVDLDQNVLKKSFSAQLISSYPRIDGPSVQVVRVGKELIVKESDGTGRIRFFDMGSRLHTFQEIPTEEELNKYLISIGCEIEDWR